jgi:hypothetical protein
MYSNTLRVEPKKIYSNLHNSEPRREVVGSDFDVDVDKQRIYGVELEPDLGILHLSGDDVDDPARDVHVALKI